MENSKKRYNSIPIPRTPQSPAQPKKSSSPVQTENATETYYEIEYDSCPIPGVGKFVRKSRKIETPEKDEIRELFYRMRDIARENRSFNFQNSKFYQKSAQQENARIFYKQGMFMKDFEDHYENATPFSSYFPNYQMMGYDQLRTYFSWRTEVRHGRVTDTSVSYAFLYCYELLNNIGVENPEEGLKQLMFFWNAFREYNDTLDKYMIGWLKDYHIYYELFHSFRDFVMANGLRTHYPRLLNPNDSFDLFCSVSKYDIRKSIFYNDDTVQLIRDCFDYILPILKERLEEGQICLDTYLFQPAKNLSVWMPFHNALFYPQTIQGDKRVMLSATEIYVCTQNKWTYSKAIPTEGGKQLVGYLLKQMESVLRRLTGYKHKLSAKINSIGPMTTAVLQQEGISLEKLVTELCVEFYRQATRTVVTVNPDALAKIRQESLITQEKLIVPEENAPAPAQQKISIPKPTAPTLLPEDSADSSSEPWEALWDALNDLEKQALFLLWDHQANGAHADLEQFALEHSLMPEVLMDGMNEKAMDYVGDNLLESSDSNPNIDYRIYEDYTQQVEGMVKRIWQDKYPQESPIS